MQTEILNQQRMTSIEIAEVTGKQHKNVMLKNKKIKMEMSEMVNSDSPFACYPLSSYYCRLELTFPNSIRQFSTA